MAQKDNSVPDGWGVANHDTASDGRKGVPDGWEIVNPTETKTQSGGNSPLATAAGLAVGAVKGVKAVKDVAKETAMPIAAATFIAKQLGIPMPNVGTATTWLRNRLPSLADVGEVASSMGRTAGTVGSALSRGAGALGEAATAGADALMPLVMTSQQAQDAINRGLAAQKKKPA